MKKLLSIFLVITMLVTTGTVATAYYTDIDGHWAENEIKAWSDYGVINGFDGKFSPNRYMTRGEFAVVLNQLMCYQKEGKNVFNDLSDKFYTSSILKLYQAGVMQGYDGSIKPEASITREEASVMICRALGIETADEMNRTFSDEEQVSSWSKTYINALVNSGLLNGTDGKLNPKTPIMRSEVVKILDNAVYPIRKSGNFENVNTNKIVVISTGDVTVKNSEISGKVIITQGVETGKISFTDSKIENSFVIDNDRDDFVEIKNTTVANDDILKDDAFTTEKKEEEKKPDDKESGSSGGGGGGGGGGSSGGSSTTGCGTAHNWNSGAVTTQPTCTTNGVKTYTCTVCRGTKTEVIPATGHSWNEGEVTQTPNCTEAGIKTYTCTVCSETKTEEILATGHTYVGWEKIDADTHKKTCGCGHEETEAHTWNEGIVTLEPTCTETGVKTYTCNCSETKTEEIPATGHTYGTWEKEDNTNHKKTCSCGSVEREGHTWDTGVVTKAATCTETGVKTYTCSVCSGTKSETIPATGHTYGAWEKEDETNHKKTCNCGDVSRENHTWDTGVETKAATCTETGVKTYTCSVCSGTKTEVIPVLDHTYGAWEKEDETNHKKTCSCGDVARENHTWNTGVVTKTATCTETGVKTYTCSVCSGTKTEVIPATGHTYGAWEQVDEANHKRECNCGEIETKAHTWDAGVVTKEATTIEEGVKTFTCTACNIIKTESIEKIPSPIITVENVSAYSGEEITVPVKIEKNVGLLGLEISIDYDNEVLTMIEAKQGTGLGSMSLTKPPSMTENTLYFLWDKTDADYSNGEILLLKFKVADTAPTGDYPIEVKLVSACDQDVNSVAIECVSGDVLVNRAAVTFKVKGQKYNEVRIAKGEEIGSELLKAPEVAGCKFKGWIDENGNPVTESTIANDNMTVFAKLAINVTFFEGYGDHAYEFEKIELTLDAEGKASLAESDIPSKGFAWSGYKKKDYMPSGYADYNGKYEVESEYLYRANGEWKVFDETTVLTENTEACLLFKNFNATIFGTGVEIRYSYEGGKNIATLISFLDKTISQLTAADGFKPQVYQDLTASIHGMLNSANLTDDDGYIKTINIVLDFENDEKVKTITFDEVLEMESESTLASMVALVGYDVCKKVFDKARADYVGSGTVPAELTLEFEPIEDIFKPIYKQAEEKAISEFDENIRYAENPYLQYLTEELDIFSELFKKDGGGASGNTAYKMSDIVDYFRYMVKLLIAADDTVSWYNESVDNDTISDAILAKVSAVNTRIDAVCADSQYENLPDMVMKALKSIQKINDMFLNIKPIFSGDINIQAEIKEVVDSEELYDAVEEIKNGSMGDNADIAALDDIVEIFENIAKYGTAYYKVQTSDITILSKYQLYFGDEEVTFIKSLKY